jgi:dienelactone hydrolase
MEFKGKTVEECRAWQREFASKLRSLLGPHEPPKEWKVVVERRVELPDHVREELLLVAEGTPTLPVHLLVPLGKTERSRAGILALHGHGSLGYDAVVGKESRPGAAQEIQKVKYDYGRELVRRGYVVAAPCLTPFGRRLGNRESYGTEDPCAVTFVRMELLGKVLIAENLRDCLWAYQFLAGREGVDRTRLGCVGLSYGGRMAMLTSALEPGIRVAVVSGALNLLEERVLGHYSCGAQVIPGLLSFGDVPEIASLIAPRPSLWELGSRDDLVKPPWSDEALRRLRQAYQALGASGELQVDRFEGGHEWNGQQAYPLLERVLA